ncbi:MAG TPA: ATP-binding protein, partial [Candidatus Eisenbacteria bacterium]|nr:ATP-binding protein [Candidatus Eisenbacteria bacterium]
RILRDGAQLAVFRGADGTFQAEGLDGVQRLFAFSQVKKKIGGQTVYAVVDVQVAVAFADAQRILFHNLTALAILSVLTLAAAWFAADLFVLRRVDDLMAATKELSRGNLRARTRLAYDKSELGHMARTFDDLADSLETREAEARASSEKIERQRRREAALHDINLAITSTLDLQSILDTLLERVAVLVPPGAATVCWFSKQTGNLEILAARVSGESNRTTPAQMLEQGLPAAVLKTKRPLAIPDARVDPRSTDPEFFHRHQFLSYLGLPMIAKGEALGVLSFYFKDELRFTSEDIDFLASVANQAAMAIDNSRLYEQTRHQAAELEKSNKIKDEFLGVMSHELRTPLNIIMNYTEGLITGMFGPINPDQAKGTEKIGAQARHLLYLINEILEITKIETGTVVIQQEPLDLNQFVGELRSDYAMTTGRDLLLKWHYPDDLPTIYIDGIKLKQVLTNLINNAIKFTEHGSVTVSIHAIATEQTLVFEVADTGPGIPEDQLSAIFEKFRQVDSTTTRSHSGAGLGLYIVKTFVELFGGTIAVRSKLGEGSVFIVRLPMVLSYPGAKPNAASGPAASAPPR